MSEPAEHPKPAPRWVEATSLPCFSAVKQAYHDEGYLTEMPPDFFPYYQRRLKRLMGEKRFGELARLQMKRMEMYQQGRLSEAPSEAEVYALLGSADEYHAFISVQIMEILTTNTAAYSAAVPYLSSQSRVLELGCYTGTLCRFISRCHREQVVEGCDRDSKAVEVASTLSPADRLSFFAWDYQDAAPPPRPPSNLLVSVFGAEVGAIPIPGDGGSSKDPRQDPAYLGVKAVMDPIAANWSATADRNSHLVVVSRSATAAAHLGLLDALADTGWDWLSESAHFVKVTGGLHTPEQFFPVDVLRLSTSASRAERVPAHVVVAFREETLAAASDYLF